MDGGSWWAAVYGVAQSRTRLKRLSSGISLRQLKRRNSMKEECQNIFPSSDIQYPTSLTVFQLVSPHHQMSMLFSFLFRTFCRSQLTFFSIGEKEGMQNSVDSFKNSLVVLLTIFNVSRHNNKYIKMKVSFVILSYQYSK